MAKRALFVCISNSSRSPMAEAMRDLGCDLSGHRPRHVSDLQHIMFDFVAKMDAPDIGDLVQARWMENWDVPDPARGGPREFRRVRELLLERVRRLVAGE